MVVQRCPRCKSPRIQLGYNDSPLARRLVGIHELFCNNCNLEFKGFALPRTLTRVASTKEEIAGNRRAPRLRVKLPVTVSLIEIDSISTGIRYSSELEGSTCFINQNGLAFVLSTIYIDGHDLTTTDRKLRIVLLLPTGQIFLHATLVFHEQLKKKENGQKGWMIGARITKISTADRAEFLKYMEALRWVVTQ